MLPNSRLGPYEILKRIGAGGMGEVYRAIDSRIGRIVAIKIAKSQFSDRFQREARVISSLNHPNICALYDVGEQDGVSYLVMEYIEGEQLRGPLPWDKILRYGCEIASALDSAHRKGITHRDLKPANILLTANGIKLLDFGLAKVAARAAAADETLTKALTSEGSIVGTFHYMAPEQLEGKEADARSDIWALGTILYEMATGRRAFDGATQASLIGNILHKQPSPATEEQTSLPDGLDRILGRALAKDPEERWQSARDVLLELRDVQQEKPDERLQPADSRPWKIAAGVLAATTLLLASLFFRPSLPAEAPEIRFSIDAPRETRLPSGTGAIATISPDGRNIFFRAYVSSRMTLWVRPLDASQPYRVPGSDGVTTAAWSPDGRSIAFIADHKIKRIDLGASTPAVVATVPHEVTALAWPADNNLLIGASEGPLLRVPISGGDVSPATKLDRTRGETSHESPFLDSDRRRFLFRVRSSKQEHAGIYLGDISGTDHRKVPGVSQSRYFAGFTFFLREGTRFAQRLDIDQLKLIGEPFPIPQGGAPSLSDTGVLASASTDENSRNEVVLADRKGTRISALRLPEDGLFGHPEFSPDARRVLIDFVTAHAGGAEMWSLDAAGGPPLRLTFNGGSVGVWSPDGKYVYYSGNTPQILRVPAGGGAPELIADKDVHHKHIAPGGSQMLFSTGPGPEAASIRLLHLDSDKKLDPAIAFPGDDPQISPDGRWLAYDALSAGRRVVFVESWPLGRGKWLISQGAGIQPRWRGDGRELFFLSDDYVITSVPIDVRDGGIVPGPAKTLFRLPQRMTGGRVRFDVTRDGERFAYIAPLVDEQPSRIDFVLNWHPAAVSARR